MINWYRIFVRGLAGRLFEILVKRLPVYEKDWRRTWSKRGVEIKDQENETLPLLLPMPWRTPLPIERSELR